MPRWSVIVPTVILGFTLAGYWYRVIRMARKARLRTGRAANFLPAEPLGKLLRILWIPAVLVWVSGPFLAVLPAHPPGGLRPLWRSGAATWVGAVVVVACFTATRLCWRQMGRNWRMGIDPTERNPLVATGPFGYVRHPIYTLSAVMMLATIVAIGSPAVIGAGVIHITLLGWESKREERHLLGIHGTCYQDYMNHVGAFLPRSLAPYAAVASPDPSGGPGVG